MQPMTFLVLKIATITKCCAGLVLSSFCHCGTGSHTSLPAGRDELMQTPFRCSELAVSAALK